MGVKTNMEVITNEQLHEKIASGSAIIVDVREKYEFEWGHIPGAVWVPLSDIETVTAFWALDAPIVIICNSENRSQAACRFLEREGFINVSYAVPGMQRWEGELVRSDCPEIERGRLCEGLVYLDHAATTPTAPEVASAVWWWLTQGYGNPSSTHLLGRISRDLLNRVRHQVASLIGAEDHEIIFTSGGTESNNMALWGALQAAPPERRRLITSAIEHPSILSNIEYLQKLGYQVTKLPVDDLGRVSYHELVQALDHDTALVSIMYANNEVGTIQDIKRFAAVCKQFGALFHTDAVQAVGVCPLNVNDLGVDLLSISAHKIYGPKGVGALYIRSGTKIEPLLKGGGQEFALRSGTENIPGIVGFGAASALACRRLNQVTQLEGLRNELQSQLESVPGIRFYGDPSSRLPHILCFSVEGYLGSNLVLDLDLKGFCCSSGSACKGQKPSHVLAAMGVPLKQARQAVRVSLGWGNTQEQINAFADVIRDLTANKH